MSRYKEILTAAEGPPSEDGWLAIFHLLDGCPPSTLSADEIDRLDAAFSGWPDELRRLYTAWQVALLDGKEVPWARLARWMMCSADTLASRDLSQLLAHPTLAGITGLNLNFCSMSDDDIAAVAGCSLSLRGVELMCNPISDDAMALLANSPALSAVEMLGLQSCQIGASGMARLCAAPFARLHTLYLYNNPFGDEGLAALLAASFAAGLRHLELDENGITPQGIRAMAQSRCFAGVRNLKLASSGLDAELMDCLAGSPVLAGLEVLSLRTNRIGAGGAASLAADAGLSGLRVLDLEQNHLGDEGLAALAASPHLRCLEQVDLSTNNIGAAGATALARSPVLGSVTRLEMKINRIGDEGVTALAHSPHGNNLRELFLYSTGFEEAGLTALVTARGLGALRELNLSGTWCGDAAAAAALRRARPFPGLRELNLGSMQLGEGAMASLADSALLDALETLDLDSNPLRNAGATALAASKRLAGLLALRLSSTKLTGAGVAALVGSEQLRTVQNLDLYGNTIGKKGARALARSPNLGALRWLGLFERDVGHREGFEALARSSTLPDNITAKWKKHLQKLHAAEAAERAAQRAATPPPPAQPQREQLRRALEAAPSAESWKALCAAMSAWNPEAFAAEALPEVLDAMTARWDAVIDAAPIHEYRAPEEWLKALFVGQPAPWLATARRLYLGYSYQRVAEGKRFAAALAACPHLTRVTSLELCSVAIGSHGMKSLLLAPFAERLRQLTVNLSRLTDGALRPLAAASLPELRALTLRMNKLKDGCVPHLIAATGAPRLTALSLGYNRLSATGVSALVQGLPQIRTLSLQHNPPIDDRCIDAIAAAQGLEVVVLNGTAITPGALARLSAARDDLAVRSGW